MILTVGICVECYTQYATEMHDLGSSQVTYTLVSIEQAEAHLEEMHLAGTPHSITPTIVYTAEPPLP